MHKLGLIDSHIYIDKESGKDFNRTNYRRLCRRFKKGDVLVVKAIDRLGRNYNMILDEWRKLTKEKEVDIVVIDMPLLDTRIEGKEFGWKVHSGRRPPSPFFCCPKREGNDEAKASGRNKDGKT
jgi:hypothetical protein